MRSEPDPDRERHLVEVLFEGRWCPGVMIGGWQWLPTWSRMWKTREPDYAWEGGCWHAYVHWQGLSPILTWVDLVPQDRVRLQPGQPPVGRPGAS